VKCDAERIISGRLVNNRIFNLLRIIFWNVKGKNLNNFVCAIATSTNADVVILNENSVEIGETLKDLQNNVSRDFYCPQAGPKKRFHCFSRNHNLDLSEVHDGSRTSVRKLQIGSHRTLLALVHGVDVRNYDAETRQSVAQSLADEMRFVRQQQRISNLVLLGDFNMNPYDSVMNLAQGMNAMMTRSCIERGSRRFLDKDYDFYYNPMWSLLGDNTAGPAGTVYDISGQGPYGWSMFDQVIIHHSVVNLFHSVQILTEAGNEALMTEKGRPDAKKASDHFPILVNFDGVEP
jgi:endonuclease/exonuclease/phosphatase (EEP) superfamily protein YafD